ncbi:MAG: hypothetical protein H0X36_10560 [Sphingomonadaceae bacterium]|nr:hypothetical protein [Sphingomonadaceae bacterium]
MRTFLSCCGSLIALMGATPAFAQDTAPPPEVTINGTATVVTDYRFRGISQTDKQPALQGSITVSHSSGFYASVWGSSIDDYVTATGNSNQELDLILGFKKSFGGTTFDGGLLYYFYPKTGRGNTNFAEPYLSVAHIFGPVTVKVTGNYAPKQSALALDQRSISRFTPKQDNFYLAGDLSAAIPTTPFALSAHVGHTWGPSWLSIGKSYTDWNVGASYTFKALTLGIQYVDTDGDFITPSGKNASKAGVVGSIGVAF